MTASVYPRQHTPVKAIENARNENKLILFLDGEGSRTSVVPGLRVPVPLETVGLGEWATSAAGVGVLD
jgi:ADP-dependent phosphofructokinase/glucokinase